MQNLIVVCYATRALVGSSKNVWVQEPPPHSLGREIVPEPVETRHHTEFGLSWSNGIGVGKDPETFGESRPVSLGWERG